MLALLAALTACAGPVGPVVGDWRGEVPDSSTNQIVELVLDGTAGASSGPYEVAITTENTINGGGGGTERWGGTWQREQAADGQPVFHLLDDLSGSICRYELGPDAALHPMGRGNRANYVDTSPAASLYTLFPVPHGWGYGRA
jgi:hypothetical protein